MQAPRLARAQRLCASEKMPAKTYPGVSHASTLGYKDRLELASSNYAEHERWAAGAQARAAAAGRAAGGRGLCGFSAPGLRRGR